MRARKLLLASVCLVLGALAFSSASALAFPAHVYSSAFGAPGSQPGEFEGPSGVAVNEVALGDIGDVYVADSGNNRIERFSAEGKTLIGTFDGHETPAGSLASPTAIAVDNSSSLLDPSRGDVYVLDSAHKVVDKFEADGTYLGTIEEGAEGKPFETLTGVATDAEGRVWVYQESGQIDSYSSNPASEFLTSLQSPFGATPGFAVDAQGNLYVNRGSSMFAKLNSSAEALIDAIGGEASAAGINQSTGDVFIDNLGSVGVYAGAEECTAVKPCEEAPSSSFVESFGQGHLIEGSGVAVDAATNQVYVADLATDQVNYFAPTLLPLIERGSLGTVGNASASLEVQVNAHGTATTYHVEYGTSSAYGSSTPAVDAGVEATTDHVELDGLQPGTVYHARVAASNTSGTVHGGDLVFTTRVAGSAALPDGRAYELVSPNAAGDGNVYVQQSTVGERPDVATSSPARAAANGEAVAYVAEAQPTGGAGSTGAGLGDDFRAVRTASGWSATDVMAPRRQTSEYEGFSNDLSLGALTLGEPPLTPDAPANCSVLYLNGGGETFTAAFTHTQTPGVCGSPLYAGISDDDAHVIFESEAALTPEAHAGGRGDYNLYESVAGATYLVSVLPDGQAAARATFGVSAEFPEGVDTDPFGSDFDRVISADGARIVWTDLDTEPGPEDPAGTTRLLVRENASSAAARTVQVDAAVGGGGQFRGASGDDSLIYFTKGEKLYQYALETATTTDLTPGGGVVGVAGIGNDGSEVYLVARTVLAANENSNGETAEAGSCRTAVSEGGVSRKHQVEEQQETAGVLPAGRACNLYALHVGAAPRFVAALLPSDDASEVGPNLFGGGGRYGDWAASLGLRTAEVSHDGNVLGFISTRSLTGYDNKGRNEIFTYSADDGQLLCVSCDPTGQPASLAANPQTMGETSPPTPVSITSSYQYRWVSANGSRIFFSTAQALVAQDTNARNDVYEWERDGEGSCRQSPGCIYLISGDISGEADLTDASESGDDVFFASRADLVPEDEGENVVLYDARVGGGFAHSTQACTGTGCQGVPPTTPTFATPPSVTFNGIGNYAPSVSKPKPKAKPKSAAQLREARLSKALKACRARHDKRRRAACEKTARKRYGRAVKAKKPKRSSKTASDARRTN